MNNSTFFLKNPVSCSSFIRLNIKKSIKHLSILMLFIFFGFSANAQIWVNPLTTGRPIATNYLGDNLGSSWYFNFEIGQTSWNTSDVGIGQNPDGLTGWSWASANYYEDGSYPNKHVRRDIGSFQFTAIGTWYVVGRAKANSGDASTYADEGTWSNDTNLTASSSTGSCPYFTVSPIENPTSQAGIVFSGTQIDLSWSQWNSKNVMVVRRLTSAASSSAPAQGTSYSVGNSLGSGSVVYNGSATNYSDTGLSSDLGYTYVFYSVNNNYYSAGANAIVKGGSSIAITGSTSFTLNGLPQGPNTSTVSGSTGTVTYSYVGVSGTSYSASATPPTYPGSYTVTATVAADTNYNGASSSATTFTISAGLYTYIPDTNFLNALIDSFNLQRY